MKFIASALTVSLVLCACGQSGPESEQRSALSKRLKEDCQISILEVLPDNTLSRYRIVGPEHVKTFDPEFLRGDELNLSARITLNPIGSDRAWSHTSTHVGKRIAVLCGHQEIARPMIQMPFANRFIFDIPIHEGST